MCLQKLYLIFYSQSPSRLQLKEKIISIGVRQHFWILFGEIAVKIELMSVQQNLKPGIAYFAIVFGTGFALGTVRTLWIVPRIGVRTAELLESPLMLVAIVFAAGWTSRLIDHRS